MTAQDDIRVIGEYERQHPEASAEQIGRAMTSRLTKHELVGYASAYITGWVDTLRRSKAREAEDRAARQQQTADRQQKESREADRFNEACERLLADPAIGYRNGGLDALPVRPAIRNVRTRKKFRDWAGDRFDDWYQRGLAALDGEEPEDIEFFESDWHVGGPGAYFRKKHHEAVMGLIDHTADRVRLKTTRELMATVFALGDGTEVTWGKASVEEHRQRIALLGTHAAGVVETAARHEAAIRMIEEAGVGCLADIASAEAA